MVLAETNMSINFLAEEMHVRIWVVNIVDDLHPWPRMLNKGPIV